jgi:hypothetical protein
MTCDLQHLDSVEPMSQPRVRLSPREAGAALQVSELALVSLLANRELRDVGPWNLVEFDPAEVCSVAHERADTGRVPRLCGLAARLVAEGRVDVPRPATKSSSPPSPLELIHASRPMHPDGPFFVQRRCA